MLPDNPEIAGDTTAWLAAEQREWLSKRYVTCRWNMEELLSRITDILEWEKLKFNVVL